jgi:ABC-type dipeptide/oligopeptide/nickel transport system permease component
VRADAVDLSLFYIIVGQYLFSRVLRLVPISGYAPGLDACASWRCRSAVLLARLGGEARLYRAMFLEEIGKDYVRTARAKGLAEQVVLFRHVLRNALIPIITSAGGYLPYVFLGSLVFESFFGIPGLGAYVIEAIGKQDFAIVRTWSSWARLLYIATNILIDIAYTWADPRVRLVLMMDFKFVVLWTDVALWLLLAAMLAYGVRVAPADNLRATWRRVLRDAPAHVLGTGAAGVPGGHAAGQRALPPCAAADRRAGGGAAVPTTARVESLLDLVLARPASRCARAATRRRWPGRPSPRTPSSRTGGCAPAPRLSMGAPTWPTPPRSGMATCGNAGTGRVAGLLAGPMLALMGHYHVFGTDRTGNDVLVQTLKSIRTAFVIGLLATLATLPLAVVLGILAGWFRAGSTRSSSTSTRCCRRAQRAADRRLRADGAGLPGQAPRVVRDRAERADLKLFLLCVILGLTGWAGAVPAAARRDAEAARAGLRAGRRWPSASRPRASWRATSCPT